MSDNKNIDYLSRLPPELVQYIFDLAHEPDGYSRKQKLVGPPSRKLQPFFNRAVYSSVVLRSFSSLKKFCQEDKEGMWEILRSMTIEICDDRDEEEEEEKPIETEDGDGPGEENFKAMLAWANSLESLRMWNVGRLVLVVLSSSVTACSLPKLHFLSIGSTFEPYDDPFHPAHFAPLLFLPSLTTLSLTTIMCGDSRILPSLNAIPNVPFPGLTHLYLNGPVLFSTGASNFLRCLPNISKLSLVDPDSDGQLLDLVHFLPNPSKLEYLSLVFEGYSTTSGGPKYSPKNPIRRFSNLRTLSVRGKVDLRSSVFWTDLESVTPLKSLCFGSGTELSALRLCHLVDALDLDRLEVDTLSAFTSDQEPLLYALSQRPRIPLTHAQLNARPPAPPTELGIIRPRWTEDFSRDGFRKLVGKCRAKGVKLQGRTLSAFELEERFDSGELHREREEKRKRYIEEESEVMKDGVSAV